LLAIENGHACNQRYFRLGLGSRYLQMSEAALLKEVQGVTEANKLLTEGW
jgi:hypothetical protein